MPAPDEKTSVGLVIVANLKPGIATMFGTPTIRSLFLVGAPMFFSFGLWNVLLLPFAIEVLGATEFEYGLQEGLTSVGFVLGSLFMAKYAPKLPLGTWIFVGSWVWASPGSCTAWPPASGWRIIWVTVSGFFNSPSSVARSVLLQRRRPARCAAACSRRSTSCATSSSCSAWPAPVWRSTSTSG